MKTTYIIAVVIVAIIAVVVLLLIMPAYDKNVLFRETIIEKEELVVELEGLLKKTDLWRAQIFEESLDIDKVNLAIPIGKNIPDLVTVLKSLSGHAGIILESIDSKDIEIRRSIGNSEGGKVIKSEVSLIFSGTYPAFESFLLGLENNIRIADVQVISLEPNTQLDRSIFSGSMKMTVYYR